MRYVTVSMIKAVDEYGYEVSVFKPEDSFGNRMKISIQTAKDLGFNGADDAGKIVDAYLYSDGSLAPFNK